MAVPLFEATASGLPVIATRTGGTPEVVVHGKTGLLVPANDAEALAGALERPLGDPGIRERMSTAGREWAVSNLSGDRAAERLSSYLHEVSRVGLLPLRLHRGADWEKAVSLVTYRKAKMLKPSPAAI